LQEYRDRISPKFYYLADAPIADPDGQPTIVRYSRKTKEQYVMSEAEKGKASGWSAWYQNGKWVTDDKRKKPANRLLNVNLSLKKPQRNNRKHKRL